ncbi:hypothetical protein MKW98_025104 [Papaver atlanticum]|uniref:Uncharacterized protein n=1 Tax=Papaver atlanticum TaxID=357466 RepID=A0AAD4S1S6_9MAGN|nr:hypothetical protein MKW98_025104 [Papaver atlanticum]
MLMRRIDCMFLITIHHHYAFRQRSTYVLGNRKHRSVLTRLAFFMIRYLYHLIRLYLPDFFFYEFHESNGRSVRLAHEKFLTLRQGTRTDVATVVEKGYDL